MHEPPTDKRERSSTVASLAPHATRLVATPHHRGPGRQPRGGQPVDETRPRGRSGGAPPPTAIRCPMSAERRAAGPPPRSLTLGAEAYGFRGQVWPHGRIAAVIRLACGVTYHPSPVGRLLKTLRWSRQKPARRARQRDEARLARWRQETWPAINRGRKPTGKASSSSMSPDSLPCPVWSAPMPRWATRRVSRSGGLAIISRP